MPDAIKILLKAQDKTKAAFKSVDSSMTKMKKSSKILAAALGPIGAFAAAGSLLLIGRQALTSADEIQKMSQRLSISTEALSQYKHVADLSGTSFEALAKGISKSQRTIADADDGLSTAIRAIDDTGLSLEALKRLKPEEAFEALGEAVAAIEDPFTRASAAANIFGRAGKEMLPIFNKGAEAVREMRREADRLGLTMTQEMADTAAEAVDANTRLSASFKGLASQLTIQFAPAITAAADGMSKLVAASNKVSEINERLKANRAAEEWAERVQAAIDDMRQSEEGIPDEFLSRWLKRIDFPALRLYVEEILRAQDATRALSAEVDATRRAGEFGGDLLGLSKGQAAKDSVAKFAAETDKINASLKQTNFELSLIDLTVDEVFGRQEALEDMRFNIQGLGEDAEAAAGSMSKIAPEAGEAAMIMETEGINAAQAFGDAIVQSALRGEDALKSLGNIARSIFGQIISSFIGIGVRSVFNPVGAAADPGFIGPLQSAAPGGGNFNIENMNVSANSTISNDPMSIRRLALQLQDELRLVTATQGFRG